MIDKESQPSNRNNQKLHAESVVIGIIGGLELDKHKVDSEDGGAHKEDLHDGVVGRDEGGEQVQVASQKHQGKQDLGLARDTCKHMHTLQIHIHLQLSQYPVSILC